MDVGALILKVTQKIILVNIGNTTKVNHFLFILNNVTH